MDINKLLQLSIKEYQTGNLHLAKNSLTKILKFQPHNADVLNFIGVIYFELRNFDSAILYFKKALQFNPKFADAYFNLGNAFKEIGKRDEAITCYQTALELNPNLVGAYNNLGSVFQEKQELVEAISCYRKALHLNPNFVDALYNLGNILREKRQLDEAVSCYKKAIELNPSLAGAYNNLGSIFQEKQQLVEAISYYQKALDLNPNVAGAYTNLGGALQELGKYDKAIAFYEKALNLNPNIAEANNNLGSIFKEKGQLDEAEAYFRRAAAIDPNNLIYSENLLFQMLYNSRYDSESIFLEHLQFAKKYADPLSLTIPPHRNDKTLYRKLRIGYLSPDFRKHAVSSFIEPVLIAHNREYFEVFCYSNVLNKDEVTERIQGHADYWRNIVGTSDEDAVKMIREDAIDILVDLAGHTKNNRLLLFARKPAPVQVNWIGYPFTTGLSAIDYKIVDNYTDPPGKTDRFYTEKLMRLPESAICYLPNRNSPAIGFMPALSAGHITFGSFNNFAKVTSEVFTLWAMVLNAIPDSCLIMKGKSFSDKKTCEFALNILTQRGVNSERITLQPFEQSPLYLEAYNSVDIGLDTFPWNGITTTCDALWMGVPVITLAGTAYASRGGVSLLSNVGLQDLIAKTYDEYIEIAVRLASDIKTLHSLRNSLRDRMSQSPLTNAKRFIVNLEQCYHKMWENWCECA